MTARRGSAPSRRWSIATARPCCAACRAILRDEHAAADGFQAVFLVLAQRAGSLRVVNSLAPWLHEVAGRVCRCARASAARRRRHEQHAAELADLSGSGSSSSRETGPDDLGTILHEEIDRLPPRYRAPVVLCFVEGLTREQAAGRLRWPVGTVQSRLARGRQRLRDRLVRRGLAPSAGGFLAASGTQAEAMSAPLVAVSAGLLDATTRAALVLTSAAGRSAIVGSIAAPTALSEEVLKTMFHHELRRIAGAMIAGVLLGAGVVGAGAAWALQSRGPGPVPAAAGSPPPSAPSAAPVVASPPSGESAEPEAVADEPDVLKYDDGQADGKQSIGGSGEMIAFSAEKAPVRVAGIRLHASRYGNPEAPDESFLIYFLDEDRRHILHTEMAPYSLFERGDERWVNHRFERPLELPKSFWVVVDFRAGRTKGVYLSYDTSTGGKHSLIGLPGLPTSRPRFGGDWMIEAVLAR